MKQLWDHEFEAARRGEDFIPMMTLMARMGAYFASFTLPSDRPNCYSTFIEALARSGLVGSKRLAIATMNYECLLELACESCGVPVGVSPIAPHPGALTVWKPHGACNLVLEAVASGMWQGVTVAATPNWINAPLVVVSPERVVHLYSDQVNGAPAMSLYARGKHTPMTPGPIVAARERWTDWSRSADVVMSIGARFNSADVHIWSGVIEGTSRIWFVGDDESAVRLREELTEGNRFWHVANHFDVALPALLNRLRVLA